MILSCTMNLLLLSDKVINFKRWSRSTKHRKQICLITQVNLWILTMTTVIMISNDNSVIITNSDTSETSTPGKSHLCSPDSGSGSSGDSPELRCHVTKAGPIRKQLSQDGPMRKQHHQPRKLSVSTVESDSEELNNSSSSTTSTLSSRYKYIYEIGDSLPL